MFLCVRGRNGPPHTKAKNEYFFKGILKGKRSFRGGRLDIRKSPPHESSKMSIFQKMVHETQLPQKLSYNVPTCFKRPKAIPSRLKKNFFHSRDIFFVQKVWSKSEFGVLQSRWYTKMLEKNTTKFDKKFFLIFFF